MKTSSSLLLLAECSFFTFFEIVAVPSNLEDVNVGAIVFKTLSLLFILDDADISDFRTISLSNEFASRIKVRRPTTITVQF